VRVGVLWINRQRCPANLFGFCQPTMSRQQLSETRVWPASSRCRRYRCSQGLLCGFIVSTLNFGNRLYFKRVYVPYILFQDLDGYRVCRLKLPRLDSMTSRPDLLR
jgi:hypothetical protein